MSKTVGEKIPQESKPLPSLAMINFDGTWHEIQKYASRSVCGKELNSSKMRLATAEALPIGGRTCPDCEAKKAEFAKQRQNRQLNRRFEDHKAWVQRTASAKKNTLKRKQVFRQKEGFDMYGEK